MREQAIVKHFGLGEYAVVYHKFDSDLDSTFLPYFFLSFFRPKFDTRGPFHLALRGSTEHVFVDLKWSGND